MLVHPTGDEDALLRREFPGRIFAHRDFLVAFEMARLAGFAAGVCDGGLQDPALDGCPALCVDLPDAPRGYLDLLPAGRYRELSPRPRARLHRILLDRDLDPRPDLETLPSPGTRVVAAASIARPDAFFADLERHGLVVVERLAFADHARFPRSAVDRAIERHPGIPWLITAKDAARGELEILPTGSVAVERRLNPGPEMERILDELALAKSLSTST